MEGRTKEQQRSSTNSSRIVGAGISDIVRTAYRRALRPSQEWSRMEFTWVPLRARHNWVLFPIAHTVPG